MIHSSPKTKKISHGITLIDSGYMQGDVAAVYLLEHNGQCAIIETGTAHSVPLILAVLAENKLTPNDVAYVIPTHVHLDHAGGAGELMHLCKNAKLVIHPFGARHMIDPSKLEAGTRAVYGNEQFDALYGALRPIEASRVIEAADDFTLDFNGRILRFIDTPGHARHHFCIVDKQSKGIFTGDTFGLSYPELNTPQGAFIFATTTPVQFDPEALISSIDRIMSLNPETIYLTHFGAIKATPEIATQLKQSVQAFADIALKHQAQDNQRVEKIQDSLKQYLLEQLDKMASTLAHSTVLKVIENDTLLNAQGLDVWLTRKNSK